MSARQAKGTNAWRQRWRAFTRPYALGAVLIACVSYVNPRTPATEVHALQLAEYTSFDGRDTVSSELVTTCENGIIGDIDSRVPAAHIHYEVELEADGFPKRMDIAIWSGTSRVVEAPTQRAQSILMGDTAFIEVWRGREHQIQKTFAGKGAFPVLSSYVGLFAQLLNLLAARGTNARIPVYYVEAAGERGVAFLAEASTDSLIVQIDSTEIHAKWGVEKGLLEARVSNSRRRIVRSPNPVAAGAGARCKKRFAPMLTHTSAE